MKRSGSGRKRTIQSWIFRKEVNHDKRTVSRLYQARRQLICASVFRTRNKKADRQACSNMYILLYAFFGRSLFHADFFKSFKLFNYFINKPFFFCHAASPPLLVLLVFVNIRNSLNKAFNFLQLSYARLLIKFIASGKLSKEDTPSCATLSNKLTISCIFVDSNITFSSYNTIFCIFLLFILIFLLDVLTRSEI